MAKNNIIVYYAGEKDKIFGAIKAKFSMIKVGDEQTKKIIADISQPFSFLVSKNNIPILSNMGLVGKYDEIEKYFEKIKSIYNMIKVK